MDADEQQGDEMLLGRLQEAAGGDAALRQLRRRYDDLRRDYESLIDRLGEIEERLVDQPSQSDVAAIRTETPAGTAPTLIDEALTDPLLRLRDEYLAAGARIQDIITGLERLAADALKGQHAGATTPAEGATSEQEPEQPSSPPRRDSPEEPRPRKVNVEVHGKGFGELLDFQEKLSSVPGVSRVSINAIDAERATLVVELHREPAPEQ